MNTVHVHPTDKICEILIEGEQTDEVAHQTVVDSIRCDAEQTRLNSRAITLVDFTKIDTYQPSAMRTMVRGLSSLSFDRVAMLNTPGAIKLALTPAIELMGRSEHVKFFTDRAEAVGWLHTSE